jgi:hypothetical protein
MGQITRTTNPTGLKQVDKKHFTVRVRENSAEDRVFWLERFDYAAAGFDPLILMGCIAHAGSSEEYIDLGVVSDFNMNPVSLAGIASDRPLKFRFIFNAPGESVLVGYADGVKPLDEAGKLGSSLVDIEPIDLDGVPWKLMLPDGTGTGDKPNVLVDKSLFPTALSAANHPWFGALVMPEVMRQIALAIAEAPDSLDDPDTWISPWAGFIESLAIDPPPDLDASDNLTQQSWADEVVRRFTSKGIFKHHMAKALQEMGGEQP